MSSETFLAIIATAVTLLGTAVLPLYIKWKNAVRELKEKDNKTAFDINVSEIELHNRQGISRDAEFANILKFRDAETQRLRDRDEQQEKQLRDLWDKYIAVLDREARCDERLKILETRAGLHQLEANPEIKTGE